MSYPKVGESVIVGYRKFKSKKGTPCCLITIMSMCTDRDIRYGANGYKVQDEFVPDAQHDIINSDVIGKNVRINYEINGGKAYVKSIDLL